MIDCKDKNDSSRIIQHGSYWLLRNYVKASIHFGCNETITYTTHCDFTFLESVVPLLERWQAPVSIAVWSPRKYFVLTLQSISRLRNCNEKSSLVRQFVTFHLFFDSENIPEKVPQSFSDFEKDFKCSETKGTPEKPSDVKNLTYPINVGRNLARDAASTYFVLVSDIELYPSSGFSESFFKMIETNAQNLLTGKK